MRSQAGVWERGKAGRSVTFRYRYVFHEGDPKAAGIEKLYREYAGR